MAGAPLASVGALIRDRGAEIRIQVAIGSLGGAFRNALADDLDRHQDIRVIAATGNPGRIRTLAANSDCALLVLDSSWMNSSPQLIGELTAAPAPPRVLLFHDTLDSPAVLTAVQLGVHGCVSRDSRPAIWHRAILAIDAGDTWIPRWLMAEALADVMRSLPAGHPALLHLEQLTERQCEIVRWVAHGLSNKEIAQRLEISPMTVKTHMRNIFERVGVRGRHELASNSRMQQREG